MKIDYSHVNKGSHILIDDKYPCKIVEVHISKPGKHGAAKKQVVGIDMLTDKKHTQILKHSSIILAPEINRVMAQLNCIDDGYMDLLDVNNQQMNLKLENNDISDEITELYNNDDYNAKFMLEIEILFVTYENKEEYRIVGYKKMMF